MPSSPPWAASRLWPAAPLDGYELEAQPHGFGRRSGVPDVRLRSDGCVGACITLRRLSRAGFSSGLSRNDRAGLSGGLGRADHAGLPYARVGILSTRVIRVRAGLFGALGQFGRSGLFISLARCRPGLSTSPHGDSRPDWSAPPESVVLRRRVPSRGLHLDTLTSPIVGSSDSS